jgi:hypothetical protein
MPTAIFKDLLTRRGLPEVIALTLFEILAARRAER